MWGDRTRLARTFSAVMDGPQDVTMLVLDAPSSPDNDPAAWYASADALADAADATGRRAVVVATMAECLDEPLRDRLLARGVTPLLGLSEGLAALAAAAPQPTPAGSGHAAATAPISPTVLDEATAKTRLRGAGIAVPDGVAVGGVDAVGVRVAAGHVGYPVTLKALGHAHKSEAGAVKVGIADEAALDRALAEMPPGEGGYLVEHTVTDVVAEVLVAVRRDPPVGWLVTVGHGGVTTELWHDAQHLLAPVSSDDVARALSRLRSAPLLAGFRGRPAGDTDALVDLVVRVADWAVAENIVEIELNPVLVGRQGAVAVDALLIVEDA
jgi:acyl-CoA synthetase (NDP forming)